jgi:competence protein ComEC
MCYRISGFMLSISIEVMDWMSGLAWAAIRTVTPSPVEIILFYLLSWAVFDLCMRRTLAAAVSGAAGGGGAADPALAAAAGGGLRCSVGRATRWATTRRGAALAALGLSLMAAAVDAGYWAYQRFGRPDLRVTVLDVGQGSCVLLEFPGGGTALVDGGGFADMTAFDVGARVVAPFLWRRKITSIDTLILTHPNSDHVNGLVFIADNFNVRALWTNGESRPIAGYAALMQTAVRRAIASPSFAGIPREAMTGSARLEVLYPPVDFPERSQFQHWRRNENNNSVVVRVSLGDVSVLIPGDIMQPAEKDLVGLVGERLRSTALIAPHHGSRSSSSQEFIRAVSPKAVLISCAGRPGSGIPHPQVLQRYEAIGAGVYRTDRHGAVQLTTDGHEVEIIPFLKPH